MMKKTCALLLAAVLMTAWAPAMADEYADMRAKAEAYAGAEDYARAIACCQLAQKLRPDEEQPFLDEANLHIALQDYASAAKAISAALEVHPVSAAAWRLKCKVDVLQGDMLKFERDLVFAEVCDADLTDVYSQAASLYASAGNHEKAAEFYRLADLQSLDDGQKEQYRKALMLTGNKEDAISLGLAKLAVRNSALDATFEQGQLTLTKAEFPTVSAADFEFSDEMWAAAGIQKPADPVAFVSDYLSGADLTWLSLSPSGQSGLLVGSDETRICYYAGKYHLLYPSHTRGVEDTNDNLARVFSTRLQKLLGEEGVIYSPDGRYAAVFNIQYTLMRNQLILDPIIIDLSTGEMILTATYGNSRRDEEYAAVSTATFSADGRYLYYMLYGKIAGCLTALCRYDLLENVTERCYLSDQFHYYPYLCETDGGNFVILRDTYNNDEVTGVTTIAFDHGAWSGTEYAFDLPSKYWNPNRLLYSANSGYALIPGRILAVEVTCYAFQRVSPDEAFAGLNQYYTVSKGSPQIQACSADELRALFENWQNGASEPGTSAPFLDLPFQRILASVLSPDGHYVLLHTQDDGTRERPENSRHLYLVRLEDMAIREVAGIDPFSIAALGNRLSYQPVIEWHADTLIIGTEDGIQAYKFKQQ